MHNTFRVRGILPGGKPENIPSENHGGMHYFLTLAIQAAQAAPNSGKYAAYQVIDSDGRQRWYSEVDYDGGFNTVLGAGGVSVEVTIRSTGEPGAGTLALTAIKSALMADVLGGPA